MIKEDEFGKRLNREVHSSVVTVVPGRLYKFTMADSSRGDEMDIAMNSM